MKGTAQTAQWGRVGAVLANLHDGAMRGRKKQAGVSGQCCICRHQSGFARESTATFDGMIKLQEAWYLLMTLLLCPLAKAGSIREGFVRIWGTGPF